MRGPAQIYHGLPAMMFGFVSVTRGASRLWTETTDVRSQEESFLPNPQGFVTPAQSLTTRREELTQGLRILGRGRPRGDRKTLD